MNPNRVINGDVCQWYSSTCQLEVHQSHSLFYSLLLDYSVLRCRCWTCIGFVTMRSLCFKCCFRLKRRNMYAQVFTAWQTPLDSLCQSDLLKLWEKVSSQRHTELSTRILILCQISALQCLMSHTGDFFPSDMKHNGLCAMSHLPWVINH